MRPDKQYSFHLVPGLCITKEVIALRRVHLVRPAFDARRARAQICLALHGLPAREMNPFTALTRIRFQFLRTQ